MRVTFLNDFTYTSKTAVDFTLGDIQLKQYEPLSANNNAYQTSIAQPDLALIAPPLPPRKNAIAFDFVDLLPPNTSSTRYGVNAASNTTFASSKKYNFLYWDYSVAGHGAGNGNWLIAGVNNLIASGGAPFNRLTYSNSGWTLSDVLRFPQTDFNHFNYTNAPSNIVKGLGHWYPPSGGAMFSYNADVSGVDETSELSNANTYPRRSSMQIYSKGNLTTSNERLQMWGYDNNTNVRYTVDNNSIINATVAAPTTIVGHSGFRNKAQNVAFLVWVAGNLRFLDTNANQIAFAPCLSNYFVRSMIYDGQYNKILFLATPSNNSAFANAPGGDWQVWVGDVNESTKTVTNLVNAGTIKSSLGLNVGGGKINGTSLWFLSGCPVDKLVDVNAKTIVNTIDRVESSDKNLFKSGFLCSFAHRNFESDPVTTLTIRTTDTSNYNNWVNATYKLVRVRAQ